MVRTPQHKMSKRALLEGVPAPRRLREVSSGGQKVKGGLGIEKVRQLLVILLDKTKHVEGSLVDISSQRGGVPRLAKAATVNTSFQFGKGSQNRKTLKMVGFLLVSLQNQPERAPCKDRQDQSGLPMTGPMAVLLNSHAFSTLLLVHVSACISHICTANLTGFRALFSEDPLVDNIYMGI